MNKPEIRQQYIFNKYAIISPGRKNRPRDTKEKTLVEKNPDCPFCPKNLDPENIKAKKSLNNGDVILSLGNVFPALSPDNLQAYGYQEVVVETLKHGKALANLSLSQIKSLLKFYGEINNRISIDKKIKYILCFKNEGSKAGASLAHAHSQIFASEIIPPEIKEESAVVNKYKKVNGSCPYCDILKKEIRSERRIMADAFFGVFAPYASQYHYEAWILPFRHVDNISLLTEKELASLAKILKKILLKIKKLNLPYNFFLHNDIINKQQHFYLKIQPRDSVWAGVELGSGLIINSVSPEEAAKYYRSK